MASALSTPLENPWFNLVPLALFEFNAHGCVLRANSALSALLGYAIPAGSNLADLPQTLHRLCGWDAPLTLLALGPEDPPLQGHVTGTGTGGVGITLNSQVWAAAQMDTDRPRQFLCAIQPLAAPSNAAQAVSSIASDAAAPPLPDQAQLLHELSTILESTPAGIAYLKGETLVRCNHRFELMLGLIPGTMAGQSLDALLSSDPRINRIATQTSSELAHNPQFESTIEIEIPGQKPRWYALSARRIGESLDPIEVVAVLSDITHPRQQQAKLEALGRDRDLMFSLAGVGIAFVRDGLIQSANPALSRLVGKDGMHLSGSPVSGLYAAGPDHALPTDISGMLNGLSHWQGERALRTAQGGTLWAQVALRLVDPAQPSQGYIASFVNVDARHRAEQNLTLQADRTRAILDSVFVGIVTLDTHGIAWMNRSARRMFAGDLADFVGQPLSLVATSQLDHPFRLTDYLDDLLDGQSHTFECQVVGRDGRLFWVVGNAVVTYRDDNQREITYALLDIDRRREAEAQSAEAQATLQRIIEMAPMAIQLIDADQLRLLQANKAASAFLLADPNASLGKPPEALFDAARARQLRVDMQSALDSGKALHREYSITTKTIPQVWDVNYLPLVREGDTADQLLLVASDITEQRAAEQARLDAAISQREMLVKEVHHRIKNNLQGVAGLLQQIAVRKPEMAEPIAEVVGQVQAIAQVYGLQVGAGGPLKLHSVIQAIALSVQRTFGRPITLSVDGHFATEWLLPEAESIPIALSLNELLTNAHKHGPGQRDITCNLISTEQSVRIDIRSPGQLPPGFSVEHVRGGVSGLGLVRALLPRRSAKLTLTQEGSWVLTRIDLAPPGISLLPSAPHLLQEPAGQQISLWPQ